MRRTLMILGLASCCIATLAADKAKTLTVSVDKKPALTLQLGDGWTSKVKGDKTSISSPKIAVNIQLWPVPNAKTVAAAIALVPGMIASEVTDFKTVATKDITVAGTPGKQIIGTGTEADDGDPSNAEVFLFSVGGQVFLLCAHGEGDNAAKQHATILEMLATAKQP